MPKDEPGVRNKLAALKRRVTAPWSQGTELIEIRQSILDEVAAKIVPVGGGRRVFPFNYLVLHLLAKTEHERTVITAALEAWDLAGQIRERLTAEHCSVADLSVEVVLLEKKTAALRDRPFFIDYQRQERRDESEVIPELTLTVLQGEPAKEVRRFRQKRVLIGRLAMVLDENGALRRRNDLAFEDQGQVNETVSRAHARIDFRSEERAYTLTDERSEYGTHIFRRGRRISVSSRNRQGIRLQSGDLIYFGLAEVKCTIRAVR